MTALLIALAGYLGGDLLGLLLARAGIGGFGAIAARTAAKSAPTIVKAALDRLLRRADRDLPDSELDQHQSDREILKSASKDWFN